MQLNEVSFKDSNGRPIVNYPLFGISARPQNYGVIPVLPIVRVADSNTGELSRQTLHKQPGILFFDNSDPDTLLNTQKVRGANLYLPEGEDFKAAYSSDDLILRTSPARENLAKKFITAPSRAIVGGIMSVLGEQILKLETSYPLIVERGAEIHPILTIGGKAREAISSILGDQLLIGFQLPGSHFNLFLQQGYQTTSQQEDALNIFESR